LSDNEALFRDLATKSQSGDKLSHGALLRELQKFLTNYLRKRIFKPDEREEVMQEILIATHKSIHTYNPEKPFMNWFLSIAEYKINDSLRLQYKRSIETSMDEVQEEITEFHLNHSTWDLQIAFTKLNDKERDIIDLIKIEGLKVSEVAKKLDLTETNVKVMTHRTLKKLQILLGKEYENG
jgi:RNA polymerase sigma-70 factor (ECF subfamily)